MNFKYNAGYKVKHCDSSGAQQKSAQHTWFHIDGNTIPKFRKGLKTIENLIDSDIVVTFIHLDINSTLPFQPFSENLF